MNNILKTFLFFLFLFGFFYSCSSDSENDDSAPPKEIGPQYIVENDSIVEFLKTHFYNYEDFETLGSNENVDLIIDTISGDNSSKISLFDQVATMKVDIMDENDEKISHNLYYIIEREGNGANPTVADSVFVTYKGQLLDNTTFDTRKNPVWLDQTSVVRGFQEFTSLLKRGEININNNGTYSFDNFGIGIAIFPSKLGYYNNATGNIPAYSPLIFQINLKTLATADHDADKVNSIFEDLNGDHIFNNDDTDEDNIPNYLDRDDDGDLILTKEEYDYNGDGSVDDTDLDGIPNYLDDDDDGDGVLTKDEYDNDGDGEPDDTDGDGIPDYLDKD